MEARACHRRRPESRSEVRRGEGLSLPPGSPLGARQRELADELLQRAGGGGELLGGGGDLLGGGRRLLGGGGDLFGGGRGLLGDGGDFGHVVLDALGGGGDLLDGG